MIRAIPKRKCFIGLFDILGFKQLILESDIEEVFRLYRYVKRSLIEGKKHIEGVWSIGRKNISNGTRIKVYAYADTFLIYTSDLNGKSQREIDYIFLELLAACDFLFIAANRKKLPIRGAITVCDLIDSSGIVIGKQIVDVYDKEKQQDWVGCWISDECARHVSKGSIAEHKNKNTIIDYCIPLKCGREEHALVFNWVTERLISKDVDILNKMKNSNRKDVRRKYRNTLEFIEFIKMEHAFAIC